MEDKKNGSDQSLFCVGSELESISVDMSRIRNLLQLFAENYEDLCAYFRKYAGEHGDYLTDRLITLQSVWETIQILLEPCTAALDTQIAAVYAEHRKRTRNAVPEMP